MRLIDFYVIGSFLLCFGVAEVTALPTKSERDLQEHFQKAAEEPGAVIFTPPHGWRLAEPDRLPPSVKAMVIGKGKHEYPPSINLTTEPYDGTTKSYLKIVKEINDAKGADWKDLGTIRTEAGSANLSQVDIKTEWGDVRMMHAILVKDGNAYLLTAACLKTEFPQFYQDFFNAFRSLRINPA